MKTGRPGKNAGSSVKIVRKRLADGTIREYRYEKAKYREVRYSLRERAGVRQIADKYFQSPEFRRLSESWRKVANYYLGILESEIGWMTLADLSDRKARTEIYQLRDKFGDRPAMSDKLIQHLKRLTSWAYERNMIDANQARGIPNLVPSNHSRAEKIWTEAHESALLAAASPEVVSLYQMALYTCLRQSDLCRLKWEQFDGQWLTVKPSKTARSSGIIVHIPVFALPPLADLFANLNRGTEFILTTDQGRPFTSINLRKRWLQAVVKAELQTVDLHFHDIRGTGITRMFNAGCTEAEVASISGHTISNTMLSAYAARSRELALNAYRKWAAAMAAEPKVLSFQKPTGNRGK